MNFYRLMLIVAFGCLSLAAAQKHPEPSQPSNQKGASAVPTTQQTAPLKKVDKPCFPGSENGLSCDGVAAKAAVAQAQSAAVQSAAVWPQFVVGAATLLAAAVAAYYAREAARHTEKGALEAKRSADTAQEALVEARKTSHVELRPWVGVELHSPNKLVFQDGKARFWCKITLRNIGLTPAIDASLDTELFFADGWGNQPHILDAFSRRALISPPRYQGITLFPREEWTTGDHATISLDENLIGEPMRENGYAQIGILVSVKYGAQGTLDKFQTTVGYWVHKKGERTVSLLRPADGDVLGDQIIMRRFEGGTAS